MNQEAKLDRFRPNIEVIEGIKRQLVNAGIESSSIPMEWLEAIVAATVKWQLQTHEGLNFTIRSLNFHWTRGKEECRYDYHADDGVIHTIPSNKIYFFAGAAIGTTTINPSKIVISQKVNHYCESCGCSLHCVTTVRDPSRDKLEAMCNGCLLQHEHPRVKDYGKKEVCNACTKNTCHHNKLYQRQLPV